MTDGKNVEKADAVRRHASQNPKVNADRVIKALERIDRLREAGVRRTEYGVTSPFMRKVAVSRDRKSRP